LRSCGVKKEPYFNLLTADIGSPGRGILWGDQVLLKFIPSVKRHTSLFLSIDS